MDNIFSPSELYLLHTLELFDRVVQQDSQQTLWSQTEIDAMNKRFNEEANNGNSEKPQRKWRFSGED